MPYLIKFNLQFLKPSVEEGSGFLPRNVGEHIYSLILKFINHSDSSLAEQIHEKHGIKPISIWAKYDEHNLLCSVGALEECVKDALERTLIKFSSEARRVVLAGRGALVKYSEDIVSEKFEDMFRFSDAERIVGLKFETPTSFRQKGRQVIFPIPYLVFGSLVKKWNAFSPIRFQFPKEIADEIMVSRYRLSTKTINFTNAPIKGFMGDVFYSLHRVSVPTRKLVVALCSFAEFCGVGYKTTMGMGKVKFLNNKVR